MPIYLSNPSKQHAIFQYRTDFSGALSGGPASVEIPSGGQVVIGHNWTAEQKARVIKQLQDRGARDAAEAHGHMKRFLGLIYRDDYQISEDEIVMAHDAVVKTQEERSVTEATRAALAFDRNANKAGRGKRLARETQVEVHQETEPHVRRTGDEVTFDLTITPDGRPDARLSV